jgi:hypothetical protein
MPELEVVGVEPTSVVLLETVTKPPRPPVEVPAAAVLAKLKNGLVSVEELAAPKRVFGVVGV